MCVRAHVLLVAPLLDCIHPSCALACDAFLVRSRPCVLCAATVCDVPLCVSVRLLTCLVPQQSRRCSRRRSNTSTTTHERSSVSFVHARACALRSFLCTTTHHDASSTGNELSLTTGLAGAVCFNNIPMRSCPSDLSCLILPEKIHVSCLLANSA